VINPTLAEMATYPFVRLEEEKRRLLAAGVDVIDFGKGDPNEPTDPMIRQALVDALPERAPYPLAQGLPELRAAAARWSRFVESDEATTVPPRRLPCDTAYHRIRAYLESIMDPPVFTQAGQEPSDRR